MSPMSRLSTEEIIMYKTVVIDEDTRVDAADALDRLLLGDEGTVRSIGDGNSDAVAGKALSRLRLLRGGEIEVILAVLVVAVSSPHLEGVGLYPRNLILGDDPAVVYPVDEVVRRIHLYLDNM